MKIGVLAFVTQVTADPPSLARKAEDLGFESFFLPEHPVIPVNYATRYPGNPEGKLPESGAHFIDPFIGLAWAAAATKTIGLGTGICLVPEHDPIILAKTIATLDYYSGGRFIFGIGAGWLAEESAIMGVDFKRRWPMTREYIRAMKELWTKEESSFEGEFLKFPPLKCFPKPARKPHPPVHIGATAGGKLRERALRDTIAIGDGWAPLGLTPAELAEELGKLKKMAAEAGRDFSKLEISLYAPPTDGDPRRTIKQYEEAGAHRLIFILDAPAPSTCEAQLTNIAQAWISH